MLHTTELAGLDPTGARLVSWSSRAIWHLPETQAAVAITRPHTRTREQVAGEARAVCAATSADVRTPRLLAGPFELPQHRFGLVFEWLEGKTLSGDEAWPLAVAQAVRLATAPPGGLPLLSMHLPAPQERRVDVLGPSLEIAFMNRWRLASSTVAGLLQDGPLVLCHGDLQPANVLVDDMGEGWLIDLEHACLAPPEWDPAKMMILARRFGGPAEPAALLSAWPPLDRSRRNACIAAQETLNVGWLVQMAMQGTPGAAREARRRAQGLHGGGPPWRHLC